MVTLRSRPGTLAIVHWQQMAPAPEDLVRQYLRQTWELDPETLQLQALTEPWFRNWGHQIRMTPPCDLVCKSKAY